MNKTCYYDYILKITCYNKFDKYFLNNLIIDIVNYLNMNNNENYIKVKEIIKQKNNDINILTYGVFRINPLGKSELLYIKIPYINIDMVDIINDIIIPYIENTSIHNVKRKVKSKFVNH